MASLGFAASACLLLQLRGALAFVANSSAQVLPAALSKVSRAKLSESFVADLEEEARHLPLAVDARALRRELERAFPKMDLGPGPAPAKPHHRGPKGVMWLHIHKAAGTLMCALAQLAGEVIVEPNNNCNYAGPPRFFDLFRLEDNAYPEHILGRDADWGYTCEARRKYYGEQNATWGQFERQLRASDLCGQDFLYGTLVREPIGMMLSHMNYNWGKGKGFLDRLREALRRNSTGPSQRSEGEWKLFDNYQTRVLADAMDVPAGRINHTHVGLAKRRLARHFSAVARLEDLTPEHPMFEVLGWPKEVRARVAGEPMNPSLPPEKNRVELTSEELDWLSKLNMHDLALYNHLALPK